MIFVLYVENVDLMKKLKKAIKAQKHLFNVRRRAIKMPDSFWEKEGGIAPYIRWINEQIQQCQTIINKHRKSPNGNIHARNTSSSNNSDSCNIIN